MTDYLAYHNPEKMAVSALQVRDLGVLTNHPGKCSNGDRVWMITGEGHPRRYFLRLYFTVNSIARSEVADFNWEIGGNDGHLFDPMPSIDSEPWFLELIRTMANFSLGFQPISNSDIVRGLERTAAISASAVSVG